MFSLQMLSNHTSRKSQEPGDTDYGLLSECSSYMTMPKRFASIVDDKPDDETAQMTLSEVDTDDIEQIFFPSPRRSLRDRRITTVPKMEPVTEEPYMPHQTKERSDRAEDVLHVERKGDRWEEQANTTWKNQANIIWANQANITYAQINILAENASIPRGPTSSSHEDTIEVESSQRRVPSYVDSSSDRCENHANRTSENQAHLTYAQINLLAGNVSAPRGMTSPSEEDAIEVVCSQRCVPSYVDTTSDRMENQTNNKRENQARLTPAQINLLAGNVSAPRGTTSPTHEDTIEVKVSQRCVPSYVDTPTTSAQQRPKNVPFPRRRSLERLHNHAPRRLDALLEGERRHSDCKTPKKEEYGTQRRTTPLSSRKASDEDILANLCEEVESHLRRPHIRRRSLETLNNIMKRSSEGDANRRTAHPRRRSIGIPSDHQGITKKEDTLAKNSGLFIESELYGYEDTEVPPKSSHKKMDEIDTPLGGESRKRNQNHTRRKSPCRRLSNHGVKTTETPRKDDGKHVPASNVYDYKECPLHVIVCRNNVIVDDDITASTPGDLPYQRPPLTRRRSLGKPSDHGPRLKNKVVPINPKPRPHATRRASLDGGGTGVTQHRKMPCRRRSLETSLTKLSDLGRSDSAICDLMTLVSGMPGKPADHSALPCAPKTQNDRNMSLRKTTHLSSQRNFPLDTHFTTIPEVQDGNHLPEIPDLFCF